MGYDLLYGPIEPAMLGAEIIRLNAILLIIAALAALVPLAIKTSPLARYRLVFVRK